MIHRTGNPVLLTGTYPPRLCGIGDYSALLAKQLRTIGFPISVWSRQQEVLPEYAIGVAPAWDRTGIRLLIKRLRHERPAFVHLQYERGIYDENPQITLLPFVTRLLRIPLVTTFHALEGSRRLGRLHRLSLAPLLIGSDAITVCSRRQQTALSTLPFVRQRSHLIPVGSTIPLQSPPVRESDGIIRLLYFGFVWRGRNIELLLEVLNLLQSHSISATLEIVGMVQESKYQSELMNCAERLGVANRICFTGALPAVQISERLRQAHLALLPYPTGVSTGRTTLMAALEHGLPVITFGGEENLPPLFQHGANMLIAPENDPEAFCQLVLHAASNANLREHISEGGILLAKEFTWERIAQQVALLPPYERYSTTSKLSNG